MIFRHYFNNLLYHSNKTSNIFSTTVSKPLTCSSHKNTAKEFKSSEFEFKIPEKSTQSLPRVNVQERIKEIRHAKKQSLVKTRKLNWLDKRILVSMGKYKSLQDVPDELTYKTGDMTDKNMAAVKAQIQDKGFKYFMSTEYVLTFVCVVLCTTAYVFYLKDKKNEGTVSNGKNN